MQVTKIPHARKRKILEVIFVAFTLFLLATSSFGAPKEPVSPGSSVFLKKPIKVSEFNLRDHGNQPFGKDRILGRWTFVYFGYLNCPDVCPLTMNVLQHVWQAYPEIRKPVPAQVVFVSVDPERDTSDKLAGYVKYFNTEFIGVTGTDANLEKFAKNIGSVFIYEDDPRNDDNYIVQHTTDLFLLDPNGLVVARLPEPITEKSVYQSLQAARKLKKND